MPREHDPDEVERLLDALNPDEHPADHVHDLRAVRAAATAVETAGRHLAEAVATARTNGRSWGQISIVLGISRQEALQRFGPDKDTGTPDQ